MSESTEREVRCGACNAKLDEPRNTLPDDRKPCPSCGSLARMYPVELAATITSRATLSAELTVIATPTPAVDKTQQLEEFGFKVTWYRAPDGLHLIQVHDADGNLLDAGGGHDPVDAILEVAEKLLPPT